MKINRTKGIIQHECFSADIGFFTFSSSRFGAWSNRRGWIFHIFLCSLYSFQLYRTSAKPSELFHITDEKLHRTFAPGAFTFTYPPFNRNTFAPLKESVTKTPADEEVKSGMNSDILVIFRPLTSPIDHHIVTLQKELTHMLLQKYSKISICYFETLKKFI